MRAPRLPVSVTLPVLLGLLCPAGPATAQSSRPPRAPDGHPFRSPRASALEPFHRLAPVHVSRDQTERWVGLVELGARIPVWLHRPAGGPGPAGEDLALAASLSGGAASRFDLERSDNEFVEVHFRVGLQLRAGTRRAALRLELYHASSHLGDEFLTRTGREPTSTSREAAELLLQLSPFPGLLLHAGPGIVLRSSAGLDAPSLRAGGEWLPGAGTLGPLRPYIGGELFAWEELDWRPLLHLEAGVTFGDGRYRLGALFGAGPSRAEQFFREDETVWGLVFTFGR